MKEYIEPTLSIVLLDKTDIIVTSTTEGSDDNTEGGNPFGLV